MARMLTLVLLAASVVVGAFGELITDPDARLSIDICQDNVNGTCGECPDAPKRYELGRCWTYTKSRVAFLSHDYFSASCNKTDNTFTLIRYRDDSCDGGFALKAPVGCLTRHVVGRITAEVEKSFGIPTGVSGFVLKMCETSEDSCPKDCAVNVISLEVVNGCTSTRSSDDYMSYKFSYSFSTSGVKVSLDLWDNSECTGEPIGSIKQQSISLGSISTSGLCVHLATEHWDVTCGVPASGSTPSFVGGSLQLSTCTDSTCGGCSPKELPLSDQCKSNDSLEVAFSDHPYYTASCNENDNTFTLTRYQNFNCEDGVKIKAPVGCLTRYLVAKITAELETGPLGVPTGVSGFLLNLCESDDNTTCPKKCAVNTIKLDTLSGECDYQQATDKYYYSYKVTLSVDVPSVSVGLSLWKNKDCSGNALAIVTPQKLSLTSLGEDGLCVPLATQHWNVTCVQGDGVRGAVAAIGLVTTLFAALLLL